MSATTMVPDYGVATQADVAGLTGRQILERFIEGRLPAPHPIARPMTFWLTEVGDGFAVFEGEPGEHLLNPMGNVHGGWALTLIDSACGCAAHSTLPAEVGYATIETKANFSRPITRDTAASALRRPCHREGASDPLDRAPNCSIATARCSRTGRRP